MDELTSLCKRRGFIFQSSEVYGGFAGFYDYGPLGVELRNNIKRAWWKDFVHRREDVVGLDSSIIGSPAIWKASGHVEGFSDPMVDCKESKLRFRADQLFWARAEVGVTTDKDRTTHTRQGHTHTHAATGSRRG
jgi:glycyl-tRNA synthetase